MAVAVRTDGKCGICTNEINPDDLVIDHIIPLSRGGLDMIDNLQFAHESCNARKADRLPGEQQHVRTPRVAPPSIEIPAPPTDIPRRVSMETHMSLTQAAERLGVSGKTIVNRIRAGYMIGQLVGGHFWFVPRVEVQRWEGVGRLRGGPKPRTPRGTDT